MAPKSNETLFFFFYITAFVFIKYTQNQLIIQALMRVALSVAVRNTAVLSQLTITMFDLESRFEHKIIHFKNTYKSTHVIQFSSEQFWIGMPWAANLKNIFANNKKINKLWGALGNIS